LWCKASAKKIPVSIIFDIIIKAVADTLDALAHQQLKLTFLGGMVLTPIVALAFTLLMYHPWTEYWSDGTSLVLKIGTETLGLTFSLLEVGALPALLVGWLRLAPMRWLFHQTLPRRGGFALAMAGTLLLFEATVVTTALLGSWMIKIDFKALWSICTGFSLSWLLAALWATQRVLRQHAR
jgi:hypothetical protein